MARCELCGRNDYDCGAKWLTVLNLFHLAACIPCTRELDSAAQSWPETVEYEAAGKATSAAVNGGDVELARQLSNEAFACRRLLLTRLESYFAEHKAPEAAPSEED